MKSRKNAKNTPARRQNARHRTLQFQSLEQRQLLTTVHGDFNADGYDDVAVGVPLADVGGQTDAGQVVINYGSSSGLTSRGSQVWHQDSPGVEGGAERHDWFGNALAVGDFDGDGYDDLAIGVKGEDIGNIRDAGAVNVLFGSRSGLTATGDQIWHQNSAGVNGGSESYDFFGFSLTAGDFNGDGRDDLAIGVPYETLSRGANAGIVHVLRGSSSGLTSTGDQLWHQDVAGVEGVVESRDHFGFALVAGDFNGDGRDDLAIGVPDENIGSIADAGAVNVLYGSSSGLSSSGDQVWHQNTKGIRGRAEKWDRFGQVLAAGDFNGDRRDDLVIGVPQEDWGKLVDAGAVNVIYGSAGRLSSANNQVWSQDSRGIRGKSEARDQFAASLAVGDLNRDGRDDLVIGAAFEDWGSVVDAGAINVIFGSSQRLTKANNQVWSQDSSGVYETAEQNDRFGSALWVGDFNGDGYHDAAIGVPSENAGGVLNSGGYHALYSNGSGLSAVDDIFFTLGAKKQNDRFGGLLA